MALVYYYTAVQLTVNLVKNLYNIKQSLHHSELPFEMRGEQSGAVKDFELQR